MGGMHSETGAGGGALWLMERAGAREAKVLFLIWRRKLLE